MFFPHAGCVFYRVFLFSEVLKKAQAEIDAVIGTARLPSFDDRPKLPYIEAIVKEVFRWNPVGPLGMSCALPAVGDDLTFSLQGFHINC